MKQHKYIDKETRQRMFEKDLKELMEKHNAKFFDSAIFVELEEVYDYKNDRLLKEYCTFSI